MELAGKLQFERTCLDNGLVLLVSENYRVPLLSVHALVLAGADQNPQDQPGLAFLTASLLDEGTEEYDFEEIATLIEDTGGDLTIFSQREASGISLQLKSENLSIGLGILAEMLCSPLFPEERFILEQEKVLNQLQAMNDNPQVVGSMLFDRRVYEGCPLQYPIVGTQKSVSALVPEEARSFHQRNYSPANTILAVVGAVPAAQAAELAACHFSQWKNPNFHRIELPRLQRQAEPIFETHFMDREQIHVFLGHLGIPRRNPDYYALQVMDVILGSGPGFTSRIPRRLRDEEGLAYSAYSDISESSGIYPGQFVAYIGTSPQNHEKALHGLLSEIEGILKNGISPHELETAQNFLTGSFVFEFQSNESIARFLLGVELFGLGTDYLEQYPKIIGSITREKVNQVAERYLDTVNCTTVVVGPQK